MPGMSASCAASAYVVVPADSAIAIPGSTSRAAAAAIAAFSASWRVGLGGEAGLVQGERREIAVAPPCTLTSEPALVEGLEIAPDGHVGHAEVPHELRDPHRARPRGSARGSAPGVGGRAARDLPRARHAASLMLDTASASRVGTSSGCGTFHTKVNDTHEQTVRTTRDLDIAARLRSHYRQLVRFCRRSILEEASHGMGSPCANRPLRALVRRVPSPSGRRRAAAAAPRRPAAPAPAPPRRLPRRHRQCPARYTSARRPPATWARRRSARTSTSRCPRRPSRRWSTTAPPRPGSSHGLDQ